MISSKLKQFRLACTLTQKQVAEALKIDRSTYTCYETGKSQPPIDTLVRLSKLFAVTVDDIIVKDSQEFGSVGVVSEGYADYNAQSDMTFSHLTFDEKELIAYYRLLEFEDREKLYNQIKDTAKD